MTGAKRTRHLVGAVVLAVTGLTPAIAASAFPLRQQAPASFTGTALAIGAQASAVLKGYLIVENLADPGVPYASAVLDSSGNAQSVAAYPFPGETAVSAAPLVSGLLDIFSVPNPTAPVVAQAVHPLRPDDERQDATGYWHQVAHADPSRSTAVSSGGAPAGAIGPVTESHAAVEVLEDGTVEARASVVIEGLQAAGGLITIGRVASQSITRLEPGASEPETEADLAIEGLKIGNLAIEILPSGELSVLGVNIPLPIGQGETLLNALLDPLGIEVAVVEPQPVVGGIRSQALEITTTQTVPVEGDPPATVTLVLGGAMSAISATAAASPLPEPAEPAQAASGESPAGEDSGLALPDLSLPSSAPVLSPASGGAVAPPSPEPPVAASRIVAAVDLSSAFFRLYLVAVVVAMVLAVSTSVLRNHALRAAWTRTASTSADRRMT